MAASEELKWSIKGGLSVAHKSLALLKYAQGTETIASVFGVLSGEMTPVNPPLYQAHRGAYERARSASVVRRSTLWKPGRQNERR